MSHAVCKLPGCGWTCAAESSAGPVGPLLVAGAVAYGMCRLSEWAGMFRLAVAGFSVAAIAVGIVVFALVGSIRSGRHGAKVSAVLEQIHAEDEAPGEYAGPDFDEEEDEAPELVDEEAEEAEEADPVLAPVVPIRRAAA